MMGKANLDQAPAFDATTRADGLRERGCYSCLKEALGEYEAALARAPDRSDLRDKAAGTALLLGLREKELGIPGRTYLEKVSDIMAGAFETSPYATYVAIADSLDDRVGGFVRDDMDRFRQLSRAAQSWDENLEPRFEHDDVAAYLRLSLRCSPPVFTRWKGDLPDMESLFPDAVLIRYLNAACGNRLNAPVLENVLAAVPEFREIHFFLARAALSSRNRVAAENHLLEAHAAIPRSVPTSTALAAIYQSWEEVEKSLEWYERSLAEVPEHRDALLGKTACLSTLKRHEEAIRTAETLLALGQYYIGDAYYWIAWNRNQLGDLELARESVLQAKGLLVNADVFTLSGIIAFQISKLDEARADLEEAVQLSKTNCESRLYLGQVLAKQKDWKRSGDELGDAASCYKASEQALTKEKDAVAASELAEERKQALIRKKEVQIRNAERLRATSHYNAAVGHMNSGAFDDARAHALEASFHPEFTDAATNLLARLGQSTKKPNPQR